MADELKGGQQFFSNYLKAFRETVDKLTEIQLKIEKIIPKFVVASENIKLEKDYTSKLQDVRLDPVEIMLYVNGNVTVEFFCTNMGNYQIIRNGVVVYSNYASASTVLKTDVAVSEGETLILNTPDTANDHKIKYVKIKYDEIEKPGGVIS